MMESDDDQRPEVMLNRILIVAQLLLDEVTHDLSQEQHPYPWPDAVFLPGLSIATTTASIYEIESLQT
jgi:hypothetical protein